MAKVGIDAVKDFYIVRKVVTDCGHMPGDILVKPVFIDPQVYELPCKCCLDKPFKDI